MTIAVIGGGASGMIAAIMAAMEGAEVFVFEHKDRVGKKLLVTGNGRCNFTNLDQDAANYRGEHPEFATRALEAFSYKDTLDFFEGLGIMPVERNGYYYPASNTATAVLDVLRMELKRLGVQLITSTHVKEILPGFTLVTDKESYQADRVILAAGGCAASVHGSDGSGYMLAKKLGHTTTTLVPGLTSMILEGSFSKGWQGVRTMGKVSYRDQSFQGELQLVDYGISGIPVFQLSRYVAKALEQGEKVVLHIDFMPDMEEKDFLSYMGQRIRRFPEKTLEEQFVGIYHKKLADILIKRTHLSGRMCSGQMKEPQLTKLVHQIKNFEAGVISVSGFEKAQVTVGGIDTSQVKEDTMESKIIPGLFFAGEILDIDGNCGGYNLQWAWSSGAMAGKNAAKQ